MTQTLKFSREKYLEALELLGQGVAIEIDHELCVLPLPRYRQRTSDGRHER